MVPLHVLNNIANVVTVQVKVFLHSSLRDLSGGVRCEIAQIPALNKFLKFGYAWILRVLFCKGYDRQFMRVKFNVSF